MKWGDEREVPPLKVGVYDVTRWLSLITAALPDRQLRFAGTHLSCSIEMPVVVAEGCVVLGNNHYFILMCAPVDVIDVVGRDLLELHGQCHIGWHPSFGWEAEAGEELW